MLWCARRTQALTAGAAVACLVALIVLLAAGPAEAQPPYKPLLPLARGQLLVSLGTAPQWLPESGVTTELTLFSGAPMVRNAAADNAYIALQNAGRPCAVSPARAPQPLLVIPSFYAPANLISSQRHSPFAGAQAGDYAVTLPSVVVHQHGRTRACVWLAQKPRSHGLDLSQSIRLLNGLFAASVSAIPSASTGIGGAYTLDAIDVGTPFSFAVTTLQCGVHSQDASGQVGDGRLATESIAIETNPCAGDGSTFSFAGAGGRALATLTYTITQATAAPPQIATAGACELDPVAAISLTTAYQYIQAVGCRVGRLLLAPYTSALPHGAVVGAQIDGGLAEIAPRGSAVDLVLNGRPALSGTGRRH
jgi:hypothetical protein